MFELVNGMSDESRFGFDSAGTRGVGESCSESKCRIHTGLLD